MEHVVRCFSELYDTQSTPCMAWQAELRGVRCCGTFGSNCSGDQRWHWGSCAKALTAVVVAVLVEQKKLTELGFESPLRLLCPSVFSETALGHATLRQLLTHRAGVIEDFAEDELAQLKRETSTMQDTREARKFYCLRLSARELLHEPGELWGPYSNAGYVAISCAVESYCGIAWEELVKELVAKPLGMTSLGFGMPPGPLQGHGETGEPLEGFEDALFYGAALAMHSTLDDWAKFVRLFLNLLKKGRPLHSLGIGEQVSQLLIAPSSFHGDPQRANSFEDPVGYAMGWRTRWKDAADSLEEHGRVLWHCGTNFAFQSVMLVVPKYDFFCVVGANSGSMIMRFFTIQKLDELLATMQQEVLGLDDYTRFGRQMILDQIGLKGQLKLRNARVLVVGAGGLGSAVLPYLCSAGVGTLGIVDHDRVDLGNLQRQIIHSERTVGESKVASAAKFLQSLNSSTEVIQFDALFTQENALATLRGFLIAVDCTDNVPTRYLLNDACVRAGIPLVSGSALRFQGQMCVYNYGPTSPCYRCLYPTPPPPEAVTSCSDGGIVGAITGVIGSMQALECIKLITGIGVVYAGKMLIFDGLAGTFRTAKLRGRVASCACASPETILNHDGGYYEQFCHMKPNDKHPAPDFDPVRDIMPADLKKLGNTLMIDVRTAHQFSLSRLDNTVSIPFADLTADKVRALYAQESATRPNLSIVLLCRRGRRSRAAQDLLGAQTGVFEGITCKNLYGGLRYWSEEYDKTFPNYGL